LYPISGVRTMPNTSLLVYFSLDEKLREIPARKKIVGVRLSRRERQARQA